MLGGHFITPTLVLHQELFQATSGESKGLAPQFHQIGILEPRVSKAVLDGGAAPGKSRNVCKKDCAFHCFATFPKMGRKLKECGWESEQT